jgi:hypothetical protein
MKVPSGEAFDFGFGPAAAFFGFDGGDESGATQHGEIGWV